MPIDDFLLGIVSGLVTSGIEAAFPYSSEDVFPWKRERISVTAPYTYIASETLIHRVRSAIARNAHLSMPISAEQLRQLVDSPDLAQFARLCFTGPLFEESEGKVLPLHFQSDTLEFLSESVGRQLHMDQAASRSVAQWLFAVLLETAHGILLEAAEKGSLAAVLAINARSLKVLRNEFRSLSALVLQRKRSPEVSEVADDIYRVYRPQAEAHFSMLDVHAFGEHLRLPISSLHVLPRFTRSEDRALSALPQQETFYTLRPRIHRLVVLGDPGGGKTTFARRLCHDLAQSSAPPKVLGREALPVFITVRDYANFLATNGPSIASYISARALLQTHASILVVEELLLSGRLFVIFDGLDEVTEPSTRRKVRDQIDAFATKYVSSSIVVTSRRVGYSEAALDVAIFDELLIAGMTDNDVVEYATKWFTLQSHGRAESDAVEDQVRQFMKDSEVAADLRSNPLLLSLLCTLFKEAGHIPSNRPLIYERCTTLLFERWDKSRNIAVERPFSVRVDEAIEYLAEWIYEEPSRQDGVEEDQVVHMMGSYLLDTRLESREDATSASRRFVEWCAGRPWVLTDVGFSRNDQRLFRFTHRTFLEYFVGVHLAKQHETALGLAKSMVAKIQQQRDDIVCQIAIQYKCRTGSNKATDVMVEHLLSLSRSTTVSDGISILTFCCRLLSFVSPRPALCRHTVMESLQFADHAHHGSAYAIERSILPALICCNMDNAQCVTDEVVKWLATIPAGEGHWKAGIAQSVVNWLRRISTTGRDERGLVYSPAARDMAKNIYRRDDRRWRNVDMRGPHKQ